jgi:hypothetical protein
MTFPIPSIPRNFFSFAMAKEFRDVHTGVEFHVEKNRIERLGDALRWDVGNAADFLLREIKNPIMIVSLTALALLAVSIAFYPAATLAATANVLPIVVYIKPWMVKFALYIVVQKTLMGVGVRTYGRLCNAQLMNAWHEGSIRAAHIGERRL